MYLTWYFNLFYFINLYFFVFQQWQRNALVILSFRFSYVKFVEDHSIKPSKVPLVAKKCFSFIRVFVLSNEKKELILNFLCNAKAITPLTSLFRVRTIINVKTSVALVGQPKPFNAMRVKITEFQGF